MTQRDQLYLEHILESIGRIEQFTDGISKDDFQNTILIQDAVIRNFEIIGEATKRLTAAFTQSHTDLPWQDMAGMRDKLIHHYLDVDIDVVWKTIEVDLPVLKNYIIGIGG
jgi:uncharacterized protein with HEPN domain